MHLDKSVHISDTFVSMKVFGIQALPSAKGPGLCFNNKGCFFAHLCFSFTHICLHVHERGSEVESDMQGDIEHDVAGIEALVGLMW